MGVRVRYNHFGAIARAMPREINNGVDEAAEELSGILKGILWIDTGKIRRVTTDEAAGAMHAEVHVGYYLGHGFYSGFQEFGTVKQVARPIVGPTAQAFEPRYARIMAVKVARAVSAR